MSLNSIDLLEFFLKQLNTARINPQQIINRLKSRQFINEDEFKHSVVRNVRFKTQEGAKAVEEALQVMAHSQKSSSLTLSNALCEVAFQIGSKISQENDEQNLGKYQDQIDQQLQKLQITEYNNISIIIDYGFKYDPQIVPSIIVDDGDHNRTRQKLLLDKQIKYVGISVHEHQQYDYMVIFLLTSLIKQPHEDDTKCKCSIF